MRWQRSFAGRMLTLSLLISGVLLIALGSVLTGLSDQILQERVADTSHQALAHTGRLLDSYLESICSRIIRLTSLSSVIACMSGERPSPAQALPYERKMDESISGIDLFLPVKDVLILGKNGYVYNQGRRQDLISSYDFVSKPWFQQAVTVQNGVYIQLLSLDDQLYYTPMTQPVLREQKTISLSMAVRSPDYRIVGAIVCTLNMQDLSDLFSGDVSTADEHVAFVDASGVVRAHSGGGPVGDALSLGEEDRSRLNDTESGCFTGELDGRECLICHARSRVSGWKLVSYVPIHRLRAYSARLYHILGVSLLAGLLMNLVLALFYARSIRRPVDALIRSLSCVEVGQGSLSLIPVREEYAELQQISEKFNELLSHIDTLIRKDLSTQLELSRFELAALQAQINPHFLFNTLQLLQTEIIFGNVEKSNGIIITLSQLLRYYMDCGRSTVPVAQEMEYLEKYLSLFSSKYEGRMSARLDVQPDAARLIMPKLLLQPVVENAIRHVADRTPGAITIAIQAYLRDGDLYLCVEDSGLGIDTRRLEEIRRGLERRVDWMKSSIGLANVHQRIRTMYGDRYGLSIDSGDDGTTVLIRLPCLAEPDEGALP